MISNYAMYTVVLSELLKDKYTKEAIDNALSLYPLYQGKKLYDLIPTREELNERLLNHYKYREIGFETVGRFIDELRITMCEIMPYYNERFKTIEVMADLENPFDNVDIKETFNQDTHGETTSNIESNTVIENEEESDNTTSSSANDTTTTSNTGTNNKKVVSSDTPQDELNITANNINNVSYANNVEWMNENKNDSITSNEQTDNETSSIGSASSISTNESSGTSRGESTTNTTHTFTKKGNQGVNTYAHDMNEFRTTLIDVVNEIITDKRISELFMQIY